MESKLYFMYKPYNQAKTIWSIVLDSNDNKELKVEKIIKELKQQGKKMRLDVDSVEMQIVYEDTKKMELVILQKEEGFKSIPFEVWSKGKNGFASVHNLIQVVTSERGSSVSSSFKQAKKMQTVPENLEENNSNLNKRTRSIANQKKTKNKLQLEKSDYSKYQGNIKKSKVGEIENIESLSFEQTENNQPSLLQGQIFQGVQQYLLEKYGVDQISKSEDESGNELT